MKYPSNAKPKPRPGFPRPTHKPFRPAPGGWPNRPIPKLPALPASAPIVKGVGKVASRLIPFAGAALTAYELWEYYKEQNSKYVNPAKWQVVTTCSGGQTAWGGSATNPGCGAVTQTASTVPRSIDAATGTFRWSYEYKNAPYVLGNTRPRGNIYVRVPLSPATWPSYLPSQPAPNFEPLPEAMPRPAKRPTELPILKPYPLPNRFPVRYPRPRPGEQPAKQPKPDGRPRPRPRNRPEPAVRFPLLPFPFVVLPPGFNPSVPDIVITTKPGNKNPPGNTPKPPVRTNGRSSGGRNRPPRKREKERKTNVRTVAGAGWGLINVVTEGVDFLNVLYDALPDDSPCKAKAKKASKINVATPYAKAKAVYDCFDQIDVGNALEGYVNNQVEDFVFGMMGQQVSKATGNFGLSTGLNRALKQQQEMATGDGQGIADLIPQLDIDDETGEVSVSIPALGTVSLGKFGDGKVSVQRPEKKVKD